MNSPPTIQMTVVGAPDGLRPRIERIVSETLKRWARSTAPGRAAAMIDVTCVRDREMARINRRWLDHRGATDVITFPLTPPGTWPVEGQIVVSIDTARREARRRCIDWRIELTRYVAHGMLHLLGFDDAAPDHALRMDLVESMLLDLAARARPRRRRASPR